MKNRLLLFTLFIMTLSSCQPNNELQQQLDLCKTELEQKTEALEEMVSEANDKKDSPQLVHSVYLKLKENMTADDMAVLESGILSLAQIPEVNNLIHGTFKDLGDARAMAELNYILQMEFYNVEDYKSYQQDSIHIAFKQVAGKYLNGPPVTHDFSKK